MDPGGHLRWYHNGTLPHFDQQGMYQAVTFRLADALPRAVAAAIDREAERTHPGDLQAQADERRCRCDAVLDAGRGSCLLGQPDHARTVCQALGCFHGQRYDLVAWVVMPNHVHALIHQRAGGLLGRIVQSWKTVTSKRIAGHGRLWQRDYWDRYVRDDRHFHRCIDYIHANPVKAGLVADPAAWPWSSAAPAFRR